MKVFARVASAANIEDPAVLDPLINTGSWQTLMTFTRETNRAVLQSLYPGRLH